MSDPTNALKSVIAYYEGSRRHERMLRARLREALKNVLESVRAGHIDAAKSVIKTALDNDSMLTYDSEQAVLAVISRGYDDIDEIARLTVLDPVVIERIVSDLGERGIIMAVDEGEY